MGNSNPCEEVEAKNADQSIRYADFQFEDGLYNFQADCVKFIENNISSNGVL